jgi:D-alanyl-D-alanine carboxypeptidase (penicillin-binding protein 5/6)
MPAGGISAWHPGRALALLLTGALIACAIVAGPSAAEPAPRAPNVVAACSSRVGADSVPLWLRSYDAPPAVTARAAVAIDADSGRVLFNRRMHERLAPASTTKMMTGVLAIELMGGQDRVVHSQTDSKSMEGSSVMGLWPYAALTLNDLLYGLMLPSGNDAALELARETAGSTRAFVDAMNAKARELDLDDTHFTNPHGLDSRAHYSSAHDLAQLARYAMGNERFRQIAATPSYRLPPPFDYDLYNGNSLLGAYAGVDGVKIGWTERAGWTFVASAQRDGRGVIVALLNTEDRDADAAALLDWAFGSYAWKAPAFDIAKIGRITSVLGFRPLEGWLSTCG